MVRSLWAAERSSCVVGVFAGWVVVRLVVVWPAMGSVVVAADMGMCGFLEGWMKGPAAKTADRLVATQAWKTLWLVAVLKTYGGRSATVATVEPPDTKSQNQRARISDKQRASIAMRDGAARGTP